MRNLLVIYLSNSIRIVVIHYTRKLLFFIALFKYLKIRKFANLKIPTFEDLKISTFEDLKISTFEDWKDIQRLKIENSTIFIS